MMDSARIHQRYGKPGIPGKLSAGGDGHNNRQAGNGIESVRRDDQNGPCDLLLFSQSRI
jgi:hypothetical protein